MLYGPNYVCKALKPYKSLKPMKILTVYKHIMYNIQCVICIQRLILLFNRIRASGGRDIDVRNKSWRK